MKVVESAFELSAEFETNKITVFIPEKFISGWAGNDIVGLSSVMTLTKSDSLLILVEKDFICIDGNAEDEADYYENPNKTC